MPPTCCLTLLLALSAVQTQPIHPPTDAPANQPSFGEVTVPATQPGQAVEERIIGTVLRPARVDATDERIAALEVPEGFDISVFARDLEAPRMLAVSKNGHVYVTSRKAGTVTRLRDTDGDGTADEQQKVVEDRPEIHGICLDEERNQVFLVDIHNVYVAPLQDSGAFGELETIIDDLPDGGQHPNRTLAVGPDDKLYVSVGSLANAADEPEERAATLLRYDLDGSNMQIFARGLRNTIGFGWHPLTDELWGMDHGIDWLGDDLPLEELNKIEQGKHYGHPWVYNDGQIVPKNAQEPPEGYKSLEAFAREVVPPAQTYTAHSAPMQLAFYTAGRFPAQYRNDAFVAMRGSWNRQPPSGYEILHIQFSDDGEPTSVEPFIGRWVSEDGTEHFGRLAGLAVLSDGSLLVSDDTNGVIYRVDYSRSDE